MSRFSIFCVDMKYGHIGVEMLARDTLVPPRSPTDRTASLPALLLSSWFLMKCWSHSQFEAQLKFVLP